MSWRGRATPSTESAPTTERAANCCMNCGIPCTFLHESPYGKQCGSCQGYWMRTGNKRPTPDSIFTKRERELYAERHNLVLPDGIYINHDDLVILANAKDNPDELFVTTNRKIVALLTQIQLNKQKISALKQKRSDSSEDLLCPRDNAYRITSHWSNDELLLAVQGVRKYGKDFDTIAKVIGTKTEEDLPEFYANYEERYNLEKIFQKHEDEKEAAAASATETANTSEKVEPNKKESSSGTITATADADNIPSTSKTAATKSKDDGVKSSTSSSNLQKDNIKMEINREADTSPTPAKKVALTVAQQDFPKAND